MNTVKFSYGDLNKFALVRSKGVYPYKFNVNC